MANAVCEHFKEKRHGMSYNLKENVLSTAGYKFIPRYCTSISLIQHPTVEGEGVDNASIKLRKAFLLRYRTAGESGEVQNAT